MKRESAGDDIGNAFHEVDLTSDKRFLSSMTVYPSRRSTSTLGRMRIHGRRSRQRPNGWMRIDDEIGIAQLACPVIDVARSEIEAHRIDHHRARHHGIVRGFVERLIPIPLESGIGRAARLWRRQRGGRCGDRSTWHQAAGHMDKGSKNPNAERPHAKPDTRYQPRRRPK